MMHRSLQWGQGQNDTLFGANRILNGQGASFFLAKSPFGLSGGRESFLHIDPLTLL